MPKTSTVSTSDRGKCKADQSVSQTISKTTKYNPRTFLGRILLLQSSSLHTAKRSRRKMRKQKKHWKIQPIKFCRSIDLANDPQLQKNSLNLPTDLQILTECLLCSQHCFGTYWQIHEVQWVYNLRNQNTYSYTHKPIYLCMHLKLTHPVRMCSKNQMNILQATRLQVLLIKSQQEYCQL